MEVLETHLWIRVQLNITFAPFLETMVCCLQVYVASKLHIPFGDYILLERLIHLTSKSSLDESSCKN